MRHLLEILCLALKYTLWQDIKGQNFKREFLEFSKTSDREILANLFYSRVRLMLYYSRVITLLARKNNASKLIPNMNLRASNASKVKLSARKFTRE